MQNMQHEKTISQLMKDSEYLKSIRVSPVKGFTNCQKILCTKIDLLELINFTSLALHQFMMRQALITSMQWEKQFIATDF